MFTGCMFPFTISTLKNARGFYSRENLLFLNIDDIYKNQISMMNKLLEFLDLPDFKSEDSEYYKD